jgi:endonuclease/exonuclease/phosphatase family metal-dependent hydrolase
MRLISMNIFGEGGGWADRREVLAAGFAELDADLLVLQETTVRDGVDQVRDLLGDGYRICHQRRRAANGQGVSIASRWPVTAVHEIDLQLGSRTADFPCTTLIAEIDAPTGPLLLANHFPSWKLTMEAERQRQAVLAARAIDALRPDLDAHVVVAGDMDADPAAASIRFWTGRQAVEGTSVCYRDAWEKAHPDEPGHTYTPDNPIMVDPDWPFRRIDYVLVRCAEHGGTPLALRDCRLVLNAPRDGVQASDHYGLVADLGALS